MRIALIVVLGFCAVFAWTLFAAQGSDGPPFTTTRFCGTWRPAGDRPRRHVVFANRMSCERARTIAVDYSRTRPTAARGRLSPRGRADLVGRRDGDAAVRSTVLASARRATAGRRPIWDWRCRAAPRGDAAARRVLG